MAKAKETKATYSAESISTVTARGQTEIPRALRKRYRVTAKSRLRWVDTGAGLLVVPLAQPIAPKNGKRRANKTTRARAAQSELSNIRPENRRAIVLLREWMQEPDDWTPEQWDDFEREIRTRGVRFRDIEL